MAVVAAVDDEPVFVQESDDVQIIHRIIPGIARSKIALSPAHPGVASAHPRFMPNESA